MSKPWKIGVSFMVLAGLGMAGGQLWAAAEKSSESDLVSLVYMGVSVASKKAESINKTPGIVSVITARDIRQMAAETLYDVLKTVPGVTLTETFFGYTAISFRGIKETHYNNRTLLLLNGHPLRDVVVGTYWLESIPANVIDHIEIIRGPGSVMYGTGAFAGVISIITKSGKPEVEASVYGGSKTTVDGNLMWVGDQAGVDYALAGSYHNSNGYPADVRDEAGVTARMGAYDQDQNAYQNNFYNVFGSVAYQGLKLDLYHFDQDKDKFGIVPNHLTTGKADTMACGGALRYQNTLAGVLWNAQTYYDLSRYEGYLNCFPPAPTGSSLDTKYSGSKWGADADARLELLESLSWLSGVAYEYQKADPYEFNNAVTHAVGPYSAFLNYYTTDDISVFTQLEYAPWEVLKVIGGVRYTRNRDYGATYVPRASLVYQPADKLFVKLLYGSAYRNPTFFEKYVNTQNVLYGDPGLKPEKINTLELGADWTLEKIVARLALFQLSTDDMIGRVKSYSLGDMPAVTLLEDRGVSTAPTRATPGYGNTQGQTINGVELEIKGEVWAEWLAYTLNASYKDGTEKSDSSAIQFLDKFVANAVLTSIWEKLTTTLSAEYVGERRGNLDPAVVAPGLTPGQSVVIPAYTLLNLKVTYHILEPLEVSVMAMNLLGQTVLYPEYVRKRIESIPGDSGRNVFGQVAYHF
jgi:iron complex outermembrane receptor protein